MLRIAHGALVKNAHHLPGRAIGAPSLPTYIVSTQIRLPQYAAIGADLLFSSMICGLVPPSSHTDACAPGHAHGICPRRLPTVALSRPLHASSMTWSSAAVAPVVP